MRDYEFEITIVAVVRVQAENEDRAREVIASSALGSPGSEEIRRANEALEGKAATILAVEISPPNSGAVKLITRLASPQTKEMQSGAPSTKELDGGREK
jgi:hypothetical protein